MPLDPALRAMMTRTVVTREVIDRDAGGQITLGEPVTRRAYVEQVRATVPSSGGVAGTQERHRPRVWLEQPISLDTVVFLDPARTQRPEDGKFPDEILEFDDADTGRPSHWQVTL